MSHDTSNRRILFAEPSGSKVFMTSTDGIQGPEALRRVLDGVDRVLVQSHMNPDPDTVGAALALKLIVEKAFGKEVQACYRGMVGRAENREMLRLIGAQFFHVSKVDEFQYEGVLLVDCQPEMGFLPGGTGLPILGVIDHHPLSAGSRGIPFVDVRPAYGSTSTILVEYLRELQIEPGPEVATGLFYGLKTDTCDLSRRTTPADLEAYEWLRERVDRSFLARIENPRLTRQYFESLVPALGRAMLYGKTVLTEIGSMPYSDMVAEVADRLIRLEGAEWAVCFGMYGQRIYLSVRTIHSNRDAGSVVKAVLRHDGVGGGHDTMAAGRIQLLDSSEETYLRVVTTMWDRFLAAVGEDPESGRRLIDGDVFGQRVHAPPSTDAPPQA
ncbi:MAG TPA: bifunctional oligoribonuclease/PAP phosphatase NrnA [Planctomycetota bacterium]|nr:bifunctional oligoribonuclease/PAP phosphatase NrnA [Planctomycetota bacterium]